MSRRQMIFVATRVPWPVATGHYLRTWHVLHGLAQEYDIHFFGFHEPAVTAAEADIARAELAKHCVSVTTTWLRAERNWLVALLVGMQSMLTGQPVVSFKYRNDAIMRRIDDLLASGSIAVMHGDSLPSVEYLRRARCPVIFTNHNAEWVRLQTLASRASGPLMRLLLRWQARLTRRYERDSLRDVGDCVVVSGADRDELSRLESRARLYIVPNGTDASRRPPVPLPRGLPNALWVGGMNDPYNRLAVRYFLTEIFPGIRARLPDFVWRVVGKSPPPELEAAAAVSGSGIELAGFVEDVSNEYARADLVVVPLTAGGGTKLKTLEAMAMRRAVVATRIGAEGIMVESGRHLIVADDPGEFSEAVVKLLGDPMLRERLADAGRTLVELHYDWQAVHRQMSAAVAAAIAAQSGSPNGIGSCAA